MLLRVFLLELVTLSRFKLDWQGSRVFLTFLYLIWDCTLTVCKSNFHNGLQCNLFFNMWCVSFLWFLDLKKKKKKENRENTVTLKVSPSHSLSLFTSKVCGYFVMFNYSSHPHCWCWALLVVCTLFFPCAWPVTDFCVLFGGWDTHSWTLVLTQPWHLGFPHQQGQAAAAAQSLGWGNMSNVWWKGIKSPILLFFLPYYGPMGMF